MSKPTLISNVLPRVTFNGYVSFAEQAERAKAANLRMGRNEAEAERAKAAARERERAAITSLGRGEYLSLRHAQWKEKLYARAVKSEAWSRFRLNKIAKRQADRARHKLEYLEWLESEPAGVSTERMPEW